MQMHDLGKDAIGRHAEYETRVRITAATFEIPAHRQEYYDSCRSRSADFRPDPARQIRSSNSYLHNIIVYVYDYFNFFVLQM